MTASTTLRKEKLDSFTVILKTCGQMIQTMSWNGCQKIGWKNTVVGCVFAVIGETTYHNRF